MSAFDSDAIDLIFAAEAAVMDDINTAPPIEKTVWILLSVSTVVVLTRLITKWRTTRRLYLDDWLMIAGLAMGYAHAVFITISLEAGFGRHIYFLTPQERYTALKFGTLSLIWSYLSPMLGRLSFCVFLLCVSKTDPLTKIWPIWLFIVLQVLVNVTATILLSATCGTHLDEIFHLKLENYTDYCLDLHIQSNFAYFAGSFNTLTDLFLTIQPALLIIHAKLDARRKLGIGSLLCLSVLAMIAALVRTVAAERLSELGDYTWDLAPYVIWVSIELNLVLTVTSLPILRPLAHETRDKTSRLLRKTMRMQDTWNDTVSLHSLTNHEDKTGAAVDVVALGSRSSRDTDQQNQDPSNVTRTVEVEVSYSVNDAPMLHAALVGLVQGQAMERLARR